MSLYYINQIYEDDLIYNDIDMHAGYAVLISENVHKIVFHSVFNENVGNDNYKHRQMHHVENDLLKLNLF